MIFSKVLSRTGGKMKINMYQEVTTQETHQNRL